MKELEKKIDEAAKEFAIKVHTKHGTTSALNAEYWWRYCAKSPESKAYWQQGLYTEEEMNDACLAGWKNAQGLNTNTYTGDEVKSLISQYLLYHEHMCALADLDHPSTYPMSVTEWFELNKKKS